MTTPVTSEALWAIGRGTGVVALVMMTVSLALGVLTRSGRAPASIGKFGVADLHRTAAMTGVGLVAVHLGSLLLDPYAQLRVIDVVLPFVGSYRPLWQGLGTVAVDVLLVVTVASLLRHRIGPRVFKLVHWSTYALWPTAFLHGIQTGTDGRAWWFVAISVACLVSVVAAVGWRVLPSYAGRGSVRTPREVLT